MTDVIGDQPANADKKAGRGKKIATGVAGLVALIIIISMLPGYEKQTDSCSAEGVQQKVVELVNEQITQAEDALNNSNNGLMALVIGHTDWPQALHLSGTQELFFSPESGYRECIADVKYSDNDQGRTGYTIEWGNKDSGLQYIKLAKAESLLNRSQSQQ